MDGSFGRISDDELIKGDRIYKKKHRQRGKMKLKAVEKTPSKGKKWVKKM